MDGGSIKDGSMKSRAALDATPGSGGNGGASSPRTPFRISIRWKTTF